MTDSRLGPGPEFDLIRTILEQDQRTRAQRASSSAVQLGPGDDAAIIAASPIVISTDLSCEGVHFRRDWIDAREIGWRAAAAALSDLAAMAAEPIGLLVSFAARQEDADAFAIEVMQGVTDAALEYDAALLGGDVSSSTGPFVIDVIVVGRSDNPVRRSGAVPGDSLWVTGELGGAAAAVASWRAGLQPAPEARDRFARPRPRIREALWLAERGALHALIDLSDGLAGDVRHLATASVALIQVEFERIPIDSAATAMARSAQADGTPLSPLRLALEGGEDYELLFAAPPTFDAVQAAEFRDRFSIPVTRIGTVAEGGGVTAVDAAGRSHPLDMMGYSHW